MTTFLDDEIGRVPGESVIPLDWAPVQAANPAWTLTGDVWETVTTEETTTLEWVGDVPLTPRMQYVMTVEAEADAAVTLRWLVHQTYYDGGTLVLADGDANIDTAADVPASAWTETARAWSAPEGVESGHFSTEITAPVGTTVQLRAPFAAPLDGPLQIRAGSISAETINGGAFTGETFTGGEFVGGEFRTSDALPGEVRLADDAADNRYFGGAVGPGIEVIPLDPTGFTHMPSIAPDFDGLMINGGKRDGVGSSIILSSPQASTMRTFTEAGSSGAVEAAPTYAMLAALTDTGAFRGVVRTGADGSWLRTTAEDGSNGIARVDTGSAKLQTFRAGGAELSSEILTSPTLSRIRTFSGNGSESGYVQANPTSAELASVDAGNGYTSRLMANADEAYMMTNAGGAARYLSVDADGVWVKTNVSGSWKHYNLEQTATMPAPEFVPYEFDASWDSASSPMGSVLVTHSTTGRHCQSRVRFNRRGSSFAITTTNTSIGRVIPTSTRTSVSMVDYIPVTLPGGVAGQLVTDYQFGHVYLKTLTGTATMAPGDYVYATLSWFLPN